VIQRIFQARDALKTHVKIAYMVNYDWQLAQLMTAGVDVWLNTPEPPLEAPGAGDGWHSLIDCISTLFDPRAIIAGPAPRSHGLTHAGVEASVNLAWFQLPGALNGDREATS
jgi:hypothetical protein